MKIKKIISEGEEMPKGYGFSYSLLLTRQYVAYPFPLNKIIGWLRNFWFKTKHASFESYYEKKLEKYKAEMDVKIIELRKARLQLQDDREDFDKYKEYLFKAIKSVTIEK